MAELSITTPQDEDGNKAPLSIIPEDGGSAAGPSYTEEGAANKSARAIFSMTPEELAKYPVQAIKTDLQLNNEENLAKFLANEEATKLKQRKFEILQAISMGKAQQGGNYALTEEENRIVQSLTKEEAVDPATVLENRFAAKVVDETIKRNPQDYEKAVAQDVNATDRIYDFEQRQIAKWEIWRTMMEKAEKTEKDQGLIPWSADFLKSLAPGYDTLKNRNLIGQSSNILYGENRQEQYKRLWDLDPAEFKRQLTETYDSLAKDNPQFASQFIRDMAGYGRLKQSFENFLSAVDIADAGAIVGGAAAKITKKVAREGLGSVSRDAVDRAAATARYLRETLSKPFVKPEDTLAVTGSTVDAATVRAIKTQSLIDKLRLDPRADTNDVAKLVDETGGSLANPYRLFDVAAPTQLNHELARRLLDTINTVSEGASRILKNVNKVARLDEGPALQQAFRKAMDTIGELYGPTVRSAVLDAHTRRVYGTDTITNTNRIEIALGKTNGDLFESEDGARTVLRDFYRIDEKAFEVKHAGGNKWYGVVSKVTDETDSSVRDAVIDADTKTPINKMGYLFNKIFSADRLVSEAQKSARKTVLASGEEIQRLYKEMARPVSALNPKERNRLARIMEVNRDTVVGDQRGYWFRNVNEYDEKFIELFGRGPSAKEREAYFVAVALNDLDYVVRNANIYRNVASQGVEEWAFKIGDTSTPSVKGIYKSDLPWDNPEDARILVIDQNGVPKVVSKNTLSPHEKSLLQESIKNKGRTVVHLWEHTRREIEEILPTDMQDQASPIAFVVSAKPVRTPLSMQQIPYRPGGHVINNTQWFVKNANIVGGRSGKAYAGDLTYSGHVTEREAQRFAQVLEQGRNLFNAEKNAGKAADRTILDNWVSRNLPFSPNEFRQQFHKGVLNPDGPIVVLRDGISYSDLGHIKNQGLKDLTKSSYLRQSYTDKAFTGERGAALYRFRKGEEGNPMWQLETARTLNPIDSLNKGLREALTSRLYNDYTMRSANEFIEQFGDLMRQSKDTLRANPIYWLYHPDWKDKAYITESPKTVAVTTTKTIPARPKTQYPDFRDGSKITGGSTQVLPDDPDIWDQYGWNNLQDAFGVRRFGDSKHAVPDWFQDVNNLAKELAERLDIELPKVWYADPPNKVSGVYWNSDTYGGAKVNTIVLDRNLTRQKALQVFAHELGHAVDYNALRNAPQKTQDAVRKAWENWLKKSDDLPIGRNRPDTTSGMTTFGDMSQGNPNSYGYLVSFNEWFADETARWLLTTKKPMTVVERFFEGLAVKWKEIYAKFFPSGKPVTNRAVASFLKGQWREDKVINTTTFQTLYPNTLTSDLTDANLAAAKSMRDAVINLVETPTHVRKAWDAVRNRALNFLYDKYGADAAQWMDESAFFKTRDPIRFMRSVAFHTKIGLFNPVQLFLNSMTLAHMYSIAPQHATGAFKDSMILFYARRTPSPEIYNYLRKKSGYRYFDELYQLMKDSGVANVGGSSAYLDDFLEPKMIQSKFGQFLDASTVFFRSAEEGVRLNAYSIAHREWRKANPDAPITDAVKRRLLQRADNLSVNMTRASNAWYNTGFTSVPAQFTSYATRLSEQLLEGAFSGKGALTRAETARVMAAYSLLFGVPTATSAAVGIWPVQAVFEQWATEKGIDLDANLMARTLSRGITQTIVDGLLANETNFSERYGPNGLSLLRDIVNGDKTMVDFLLGASGSVAGDVIGSVVPLGKALWGTMADDNKEFPLAASDFLEAARNVSSLDQATKAYMAYHWGLWFTKNEVQMSSVDGIGSISMALLGLTPRDVVDAYTAQKVIADQGKHQDEIQKLVTKEYHRAFRAIQDGDHKVADKHFTRAATYIKGAALSPQQKSALLSKALGTYGNEVDDVNMKLIERSINEDVYQKRLDKMERVNKERAQQ